MSSSDKITIYIDTEDKNYNFHGYIPELSINSFISTTKTNSLNLEQERKSSSVYDKIFHVKSEFNPKSHRDDRQHSKFLGLNQSKEEKEKSYPSRSSSEYGRRYNEYTNSNDRSHVKIEHVKKDFYRNNDFTLQ
ncbi:unnamed protein product [Adineta steineri]|uniref:Uncharacterized protein n=1 Tax=Adineta steineri TaxID=433720 RepID=A0A814DI39_9BILA|nr:unnamed protein product [Adineta steineri]CAF0956119.1 unnamed protein product [Adineta steineri]CAF0961123.1 unnamed protein product [Adineta steineri]